MFISSVQQLKIINLAFCFSLPLSSPISSWFRYGYVVKDETWDEKREKQLSVGRKLKNAKCEMMYSEMIINFSLLIRQTFTKTKNKKTRRLVKKYNVFSLLSSFWKKKMFFLELNFLNYSSKNNS